MEVLYWRCVNVGKLYCHVSIYSVFVERCLSCVAMRSWFDFHPAWTSVWLSYYSIAYKYSTKTQSNLMLFSAIQRFSSNVKQRHQTTCDLLPLIRTKKLNFHLSFFCPQTPSLARSHPRRTDATTNPRGACPSSVEVSVDPLLSAHFCSIQMPRVPKFLWTFPRRQSRGRPASATQSLSAIGPLHCTSKSASRYCVMPEWSIWVLRSRSC